MSVLGYGLLRKLTTFNYISRWRWVAKFGRSDRKESALVNRKHAPMQTWLETDVENKFPFW